jgi:hypothetical protein
MSEEELVVIPETEDEYAAWVAQHPEGFVVNVPRDRGDRQMYWHQANCSFILPSAEWRSVGPDSFKVCSVHPGALAVWAKSQSLELRYCDDCQRPWIRKHPEMQRASSPPLPCLEFHMKGKGLPERQ